MPVQRLTPKPNDKLRLKDILPVWTRAFQSLNSGKSSFISGKCPPNPEILFNQYPHMEQPDKNDPVLMPAGVGHRVSLSVFQLFFCLPKRKTAKEKGISTDSARRALALGYTSRKAHIRLGHSNTQPLTHSITHTPNHSHTQPLPHSITPTHGTIKVSQLFIRVNV